MALNYDAGREPAQNCGGQIRFRPGRYIRIALYFPVALPIIAVVDMIQHGSYAHMAQDWPYLMGTIVLFVALGFGLPQTILVDDKGVRLSGYLGIGRKRIEWSGAHATLEPSTGRVHVCGSDGTQIVHSKWHAGRLSFVFQLERRIKVYRSDVRL
jgi:hypothetical protein